MKPGWVRNRSLTSRMFFFFFCLSILVVLLMAGLSFYFYNKAVKRDFDTITQEASERLSYHLEFYLKQMEQSTGTLITTELVQRWLEGQSPLTSEEVLDLREEMETYISFNYPEIANLYLVSTDRRVLALNASVNADYGQQPWFLSSPSAKTTTLPTYRIANDQPVMSMLIPVYSSQTVKLVGSLVLEFTLKEVDATFTKSGLGKSGFFFMLSEDDRLVYYPREEWLGLGLDKTELRTLDLENLGRASVQTWQGKRYLLDVTTSEATGWRIVAIVPYRELASGLNTALYASVIAVVVIVIGLSIVIPLLLRKFIEPVKKMKAAMERVSRGDLTVRVEQISDIYEFQSLSLGFNKMTEQLTDSIRQIAELEVKEIKLQLHQQEATIHALQNQINPHLLYNSLGIISGIASLEGNSLIESISLNLADVYRYAASFANAEVTLREELSILRKYLEIVHIRFPKQFVSRIVVSESFLDCPILKLSLQPIVENAVKYGVEPRGGDGAIVVTAYAEGDDLILEIADNGPGIEESRQKSFEHAFAQVRESGPDASRESLGLPNVHNRIQLKYGPSYGIAIYSFPGRGTVIAIRVPRGPIRSDNK